MVVITTTRLWSLDRADANKPQPQPVVEGFRAPSQPTVTAPCKNAPMSARSPSAERDDALTGVSTTASLTTPSLPTPSLPTAATPASVDTPEALITRWGADPRLTWSQTLPATEGQRSESTGLTEDLWSPHAPDGLWRHQAAAIDAILAGQHVAISTGTGSGKSLCYQLPIAAKLRTGPRPTALVIQPTKALAHDQLQSFRSGWPDLLAMAFDGDADIAARQLARREARVLFTNPEMLHGSINARHTAWARFLSSLTYVVIDEIHAYRGVFGSHVAHVLRRLRRLCRHHGADPVFISTSATISDAGDLAAELIGSEVTVIADDDAATSPTTVAVWDPRQHPDQRTSAVHDTASLLAELIGAGRRSITFARARSTTEVIADLTRRRIREPRRVAAYRGGYLPAERRGLELAVAAGDIDAIVSTSALELGIDIGHLDTAVIHGFPGTMASFRQQIGRVGRRGQHGLAVLVLGDDQLDAWVARHPGQLVTRPAERVVINPDNPTVYRPHLACAAHELPLDPITDSEWWPDIVDAGVCDLASVDLLRVRNGRAAFADSVHPGRQIGLRSSDPSTVRIETTDGTLVGTVDAVAAPGAVHAGARYVHQGVAYHVQHLDLEARRAVVSVDQRGQCRSVARRTSDITVLETHRSSSRGAVSIVSGRVRVSTKVESYRVVAPSGQVLERGELDHPPHEITTDALWLTFDDGDLDQVLGDRDRLPGALHAAEHAMIGVLPLFAICDRWDVGGVSTAHHPDTLRPTVFIHDGVPGGAGISRLAYDAIADLVDTTVDLVTSCGCDDGCPSCVVSPKCGNGNEPLDRDGAVLVLGLAR